MPRKSTATIDFKMLPEAASGTGICESVVQEIQSEAGPTASAFESTPSHT